MMNALVSFAHPLRKIYWHIFRPKTFGVKVVIYTPDRTKVLLVQHRYGSGQLMLPGGAIERGEPEEAAARREVIEELNVEIDDVRLRHVFRTNAEGKQDTVFLFTAVCRGEPVANPAELAAVVFCALDELPDATSSATRRRLDEIAADQFSNTW